MGILSGLLNPARPRRRSAFGGASIGRLTSSWQADPGSINRWLRYELATMRRRARELARSDPYAAGFITAFKRNVAGPRPFVMQAKAKMSDGRPNRSANDQIEALWKARGRPGNWDVTGRMSASAWHRLAAECWARDGEFLARYVSTDGKLYLQALDIERLDEQRNDNLANGGAIKMGVEVNRYGRPVAYHILRDHPGELGEWSRMRARDSERVPADDIVHLFVPMWPEQVRGIPMMFASMLNLWHMGAFAEAAVVNARIGASKIATLQTPNGQAPENMATGKDTAGNLLTDIEPGTYWTLPEGVELGSWDPKFPEESIETFTRTVLRGAAAGVGMAAHSFANDPSDVNYSTARVFLLEERDSWMTFQDHYIEHFCFPDLARWLEWESLRTQGDLPVTFTKFAEQCRFQGKRWQWIDPQKEVAAKKEAVGLRITSRSRIAAEQGEDWDEIVDELAEEEATAREKGVELEPKPAQTQQASDAGNADQGSGEPAGDADADPEPDA